MLDKAKLFEVGEVGKNFVFFLSADMRSSQPMIQAWIQHFTANGEVLEVREVLKGRHRI